jgi:hypothetical protein
MCQQSNSSTTWPPTKTKHGMTFLYLFL